MEKVKLFLINVVLALSVVCVCGLMILQPIIWLVLNGLAKLHIKFDGLTGPKNPNG